jgi:hypothetical protein
MLNYRLIKPHGVIRSTILNMKRVRTKWSDPEEDAVLIKLSRGERLTRKDHFTLAKIYEIHGPSSVYMAMGNLNGNLPHISKRLASAQKRAEA